MMNAKQFCLLGLSVVMALLILGVAWLTTAIQSQAVAPMALASSVDARVSSTSDTHTGGDISAPDRARAPEALHSAPPSSSELPPLPLPPMPVTGTFYFDPPPAGYVSPSLLRQPLWGPPSSPAPMPRSRHPPQIPTALQDLSYTQLDVLVVVYTHTVDGVFTDTLGLQQQVDEAETFYWRNSHLQLDLAIDVMWIDEYKELDEFWELWPDAYWLTFWDTDGDGNSVTQDLYDRGVSDDQYDGVFVYYAWGQGPHGAALGGGAFGVDVGFMGQTGYAAVPLEWALSSQDWYFIHEFHHQLDSMFYHSGYPAYPHADIPHPLPGDFGENYDFNAAILRGWPLADWAGLALPWHTPASTLDSDGDGLPDDGPGLLVTESSIGADPLLPDGDGDGLDDLGEAMAGFFGPSDPAAADTDADALPDGIDPYPLYPVNRHALSGTITIDGVIGEGEGWRLFDNALWQLVSNEPFSATFYTAWDDDYLYLGFHVSHFAYVRLYLDANNDGWFHGPDNYAIGFDPSYTYPTTWDLEVHVWDVSLGTLCANPGGPWPMWDDDPAYPFPRLVQPDDIVRYAQSDGGTGYVAELAIPASIDTGLIPEPGDVIGLRVVLNDLHWVIGRSASLFETESFVDLGLVQGLNGTSDLFGSSALAPLWTWEDPLGDCDYSLTDQPDSLRVYVPDGGHDIYLNTDAPRVLQLASGDFAIQTQVTISPLYAYQGAGLLVWADADNYARLERGGGPDQQIQIWYRNGGLYDWGGAADVSTTSVHLRFERSGNSFTGLYSLDGVDWTPVGTVSLQAGPTVGVGLDVINEWQDNPIHADFSYFQVTPAFDVAPPGGTLVIDGGRPYAGDPWVTLAFAAIDPSGVFRMQLDDGRQLWSLQSYTTTWPAVLPDGEGSKAISVRLQDNLGNTSTPISNVVWLDQTPPTATFSLGQSGVNGQITTTLYVTATDDVAGVATMMFSNEWDWEAETLSHQVGQGVSDPDASGGAAWVAYSSQHIPGLMVYGPGTFDLTPGRSYRAIFRLKVTENWVPCPVVTLDVFDRDGQGDERLLVSRGVAANEFLQPNVYQEFALDFYYPDVGNSGLEFRAHFEDRSDVYADRMTVFGAPQLYSPTTTWWLASSGGQRLASSGGQHAVWGRFVDAADNVIQTQAMIVFNPLVQVSTGVDSDYYPALVTTAGGELVSAWQRNGELWTARSADSGATWSGETQLAGCCRYQPAMLRMADDSLWLTYRQSGNVWYRTSSDDGLTWSSEVQLTEHAANDVNPDLAQTTDGRIWVVWESERGSGSNIWYKTTPDNGISWSLDVGLSVDSGWNTNPTMAQAQDGTLWMVWFRDYSLAYSTSINGGSTWSPLGFLDAGGPMVGPSLRRAADGTGTLWLAYSVVRYEAGRWRSNLYYQTSTDSGATWSGPQQFTIFVGDNSDPAVTPLGDGQVGMAWHSDRTGVHKVWFGIPGLHADVDPPPHVSGVEQIPPSNPDSDDVITVRGWAHDETGLSSVELLWGINGVAQADLTMYDDGAHDDGDAGDGQYGVQIGPLSVGTSVTYTMRATDVDNNRFTYAEMRSFEVLEPFTKTADILFVPDRGGNSTDWLCPYFTDVLDELGHGYDVWDTELRGAPDSATLNLYTDGVVIWAGPDWGYFQDSDVQQEIQAYLDAGGRLFITGQDIGYYAGSTSFYQNYLHASYVQDDMALYLLDGIAGDPIGDGLTLGISGGDGADNQWFPSEIDPLAPAVPVLTYDATAVTAMAEPARPQRNWPKREGEEPRPTPTPAPWDEPEKPPERPPKPDGSISPAGVISSGTAGLRVDTGTYRVVYFAFGFEGINSAEDRQTVMDRVVRWLGPWPTLSGLPDQVFDHSTSLPATIDLWAYASDAESAPSELAYTIEGTPPAGAGVTLESNRYVTVHPSPNWCGGTDVTIRCTDPGGLWDTDTFRVAVSWSCPGPVEMPGAPVLIAPVDGRAAHSGTPTFAWHAVGGSEGYQLQVDDDADFSSPERDETMAGTEHTPASGLSGGTYCWRVRAVNGNEVATWSARWEFTAPAPSLPEFKLYLPVVTRNYVLPR